MACRFVAPAEKDGAVMTRVPLLAVGPDTEAATSAVGFWTVAALLALAVVAGASIRVVASTERAVVFRRSRVVRVRGPGVALHLPGVERLVTVSLTSVEMPLVVSAATKDGVRVRVIATAVCRPSNPALWARQDAPFEAAALAVEEALRRELAERRLVELLQGAEVVETLLPVEVSAHTASWGGEVREIRVNDIETRLSPQLLRALRIQ